MSSAAGRRKYALDTNLFVKAMRSAASAAQLGEFHAMFAPFEYLSAVVVQELRAGLQWSQRITSN